MKKIAFMLICLIGLLSSVSTWAQSFNQNYFRDGMYFFDGLEKIKKNDLFTAYKSEFGLSTNDSMGIYDEQVVISGKFRTLYKQYYKGIPVESGIMTVTGEQGIAYTACGFVLAGLDIDTSYTVPSDSAFQTALIFSGGTNFPWNDSTIIENYRDLVDDSTAIMPTPKGDLVIVKLRQDSLEEITDNYKRCWHFYIAPTDSGITPKDIYVDAETNVVYTYQEAFRCFTNHIGTGWTRYDGWFNNLSTRRRTISTKYQAGDETRHIVALKEKSRDIWKDNDDDWTEGVSSTAVSAFWGLQRAWDYFFIKHGWQGIDNKWGELLLLTDDTHLPSRNSAYAYDASLNKDCIAISPDDGSYSMGMMDVMGHEYTHSVIKYSSGLGSNTKDWDANSLNEAFADILGHRVEAYSRGWADWILGENAGIYQRSLSDPYSDKGGSHTVSGKSADYYKHPTLWQYYQDYGLYTNGGVMRKWNYILSVGGTIYHPVTGVPTTYPGLGAEKAANIAQVGVRWWFWHNLSYEQAAQQLVNHTITDYGRCSQEHKLTARILRSLGFTNIATFLCANDLEILGNRTINVQSGPPTIVKLKVKQHNDNDDDSGQPIPGSYLWTIPTGWTGTQSGDSLTVLSFANFDSKMVSVKFTSTDSTIVTSDSTVIHFSDEGWIVTDTNSNNQFRVTNKAAIPDEENLISIFPNPAINTVHIDLSDITRLATLTISDITGRNIFKTILSNFNNKIDISNIPEGNYIINVDQNSQRTSQKLTIIH